MRIEFDWKNINDEQPEIGSKVIIKKDGVIVIGIYKSNGNVVGRFFNMYRLKLMDELSWNIGNDDAWDYFNTDWGVDEMNEKKNIIKLFEEFD